MTVVIGRHLTEPERKRIKAALRKEVPSKELAAYLQVSYTTLLSIYRKMKADGEKVPKPGVRPVKPVVKDAPTPAHERKITGLQDQVRDLNHKLREAHRESINEDAIKRLLGVLSDAPTEPPAWIGATPKKTGKATPEVPVTTWSDWHLGEVVEPAEVNGVNEYNIEIAERRIKRLYESTIDICLNHGPGNYPGIVVNILGDMVSGMLHPELAKTDEEEIIPTVLRARDLLVTGLTMMADTFGRVYVPCTSGNHGRIGQKPEFKRYYQKNWDWLIAQLLIRHFDGDKRIRIDAPAANEVYYQVYGTRFLAMHGDMLGVKGGDGIIAALGPIARGEIKVRGHSASFGRDYDMLLIGHWHQSLWLPKVTVANCIKGYDEYAKNALRAPVSEPSQPLFFVHPRRGITSRWEVKVNDPKPAAKEWVTWGA